MTEQVISIENRGAIEVVSLNRPDRLNARHEPLLQALLDYFTGLNHRHDVRVASLHGHRYAVCLTIARPAAMQRVSLPACAASGR